VSTVQTSAPSFQTGPGSTRTPITVVHATVSPGARLSLPWRSDFNALAYVLAGAGTVGEPGRSGPASWRCSVPATW
jgi:redox-sensitive bicupin YhaK (pirin superfamily)